MGVSRLSAWSSFFFLLGEHDEGFTLRKSSASEKKRYYISENSN